jgi:hypothetical protein
LTINDEHLINNPTDRPIESLCLANCEVTEVGLKSIGPQPELNWLDLSRLPIGDPEVASLVVAPEKIEQLTLEATRVGASIAPLIARMPNLYELDLSWTTADDSVVASIASAPKMSVLWMTGTKISDDSIAKLMSMRKLESVDVQRTGITPGGVEMLTENVSATVNPLELRSSP